MEVNEKYRAPEANFLSLCLREGVKLSVGSDAHNPEEVGKIDWAMSTLRKVGAKREDLILEIPSKRAR
jgi:putative hydrolase